MQNIPCVYSKQQVVSQRFCNTITVTIQGYNGLGKRAEL
jgi:hypothetical protein